MTFSPRIALAIFRKDVVDALRDTRILIILLTPLLLALLINALLPAERRVEVKLAYAGPDLEATALVEHVRDGVRATIDVRLTQLAAEEDVSAAVRDRKADIGLIAPPRVLTELREGRTPRIAVVLPVGAVAGGEIVLRQVGTSVRTLAGQPPPAAIETVPVERPGERPAAFTQLGFRAAFILAILVMTIGMIAIVVLPMLIAEESERRTLDALLMVGSYADVVVAKTFVGLLYMALGTGVLLGLTRLPPKDAVMFVAAALLLAVSLVGFGLLLGGIFRNANQIYTWSSFFLIPVMAPPFAVVAPDLPPWLSAALRAIPTSEVMRILSNGMAGSEVYKDPYVSVSVIAAWGLAAYALLGWQLARREG